MMVYSTFFWYFTGRENVVLAPLHLYFVAGRENNIYRSIFFFFLCTGRDNMVYLLLLLLVRPMMVYLLF